MAYDNKGGGTFQTTQDNKQAAERTDKAPQFDQAVNIPQRPASQQQRRNPAPVQGNQ